MTVSRVLVANRGEIAVRIIRACQLLELETVLAVSDADRLSMPAQLADRVVCIGAASPAESYLSPSRLVMAALGTECDALHPGYGFLAESPELSRLCAEHGITFVGPDADVISVMGDKIAARRAARRAGVSLGEASGALDDVVAAERFARKVGYPVLIKASGGGGGRGMRIVREESGLRQALSAAMAESKAAFGNPTVYAERYIERGRHIEVQVLGDRAGGARHLGTRDCTAQRRYQKIIEEATASIITREIRDEMESQAVRLVTAMNYVGAGTVEYLVDLDTGIFTFLEMNTRIQVEHPVTECVTGVDLVRSQLEIAGGTEIPWTQTQLSFDGHALECRINAESVPGFRPSPGTITQFVPPEGDGIRVDTHCFTGYTVPPFYDSLLAKLVVHSTSRTSAIEKCVNALDAFIVEGIKTNIPFLKYLLETDAFVSDDFDTTWLAEAERDFERALADANA